MDNELTSGNPREVLKDFLRQIGEGDEHCIQIHERIIPEGEDGAGGKQIVFAMQNRRLQPEPPNHPERMETPSRSHVFFEAAGFAAYIESATGNEEKGGRCLVLADVTAGKIKAVLDDSADEGAEVVMFCPTPHPHAESWTGLIGEPMTLEQFVLHVLDNRRTIIEPEAGELLMTLRQVRASKNVTIEQGFAAKGALNGVMVETTIQGEVRNQPVELPESLTVEMPLFIGDLPTSFAIDIALSSPGNEVIVRLASSDYEVKRIEAFDLMVYRIKNLLANKPGIVFSTGLPSYQPWQYIPQAIAPGQND